MSGKRKRGNHKPKPDLPKNGGDQHHQDAPCNHPPICKVEITFSPSLVEKHEAEQEQSESREDTKQIIAVITLIGVFIAAGAAFWQGCYTKIAATAATDAAKTAEQSLTSVQRPFIYFLGKIAAAKTIKDKKLTELVVTLPWENSGVTPTTNGISQVNWKAFPPDGMPHDFSFQDEPSEDRRQFEIPPKGTGNSTLKIPISWINAAVKGNVRIYVWGWITYDDIFPGTPRRLSEFCDEITNLKSTKADITDPATDISWDMALCRTHNCSDERCSDYKTEIQHQN